MKTNGETMTVKRPDCAGFHEPDPICDGDGAEPPCAYRDRCLALITIADGATGPASMAALKDEWDEDRLDQWFEEQAEGEAWTEEEREERLKLERDLALVGPPPAPATAPLTSPAPKDDPIPPPPPRPPSRAPTAPEGDGPLPGWGKKIRRRRPAFDVHPRPSPRYDHVLPVVDAIAERVAHELRRRLMPENDPDVRVGDLFLRYTPGMQGRLIALYEATGRRAFRHRVLARFVLLVRDPRLNMKTNASDLIGCVAEDPPSSVVCRLWKDTKPAVTLVGVDAHTARASAIWLLRLYNAGLIEGRV
jgi:hypothetical protein